MTDLQPPQGSGYTGSLDPTSGSNAFNAHAFLIKQIIAGKAHAALVMVVAVTNNGGVAADGFVDVQPLVNQMDGNGNTMPQGVIHNLPYYRLRGGASAIILDPEVGDIGLAVFADRDSSIVKSTRKQANPGSFRKNDWADGMYFGGFLNGIPVQYVQFLPGGKGINLVSPGTVTINAADVVVYGLHSYSWDVGGYGQRITLTGGINYQVDEYFNGALVTTTDHGLHQPEIPGPS